MNRFALRLAFSFYVFMLRARVKQTARQARQWDCFCLWQNIRWEINEMFSRLYIKKFLACIALAWLVCTVYMFQNGGIVAGLYFVALGVSPALVFVWLVTHAPKKEGEQ